MGRAASNTEFYLKLDQEEYLSWYQGTAKTVVTRDVYGRKIAFPANILQGFVSHCGVEGRFKINFDEDNRFVSIEKMS